MNELQHHGIKGMKWGIRRYQNRDGTLTAKGRQRQKEAQPPHEDYARARDKKSVRNMSDKELRDRINRLQLEHQYSTLTARRVSAGEKFVKDILVNAAKQTASNYISGKMTVGVKALEEALKAKKAG